MCVDALNNLGTLRWMHISEPRREPYKCDDSIRRAHRSNETEISRGRGRWQDCSPSVDQGPLAASIGRYERAIPRTRTCARLVVRSSHGGFRSSQNESEIIQVTMCTQSRMARSQQHLDLSRRDKAR